MTLYPEIASLFVGKHAIDIADLDVESYKRDLKEDIAAFEDILAKIAPIDPEHDAKLQRLREIIQEKVEAAGEDGNRKVLIFSAFADTAEYLYQNLAPQFHDGELHLDLGIVTGKNSPRCTVQGAYSDFQEILSRFSPISKERPDFDRDRERIDILFGTDCISEGQNLQDCDTVVNYDIHWNPVRIIQRFGRVGDCSNLDAFELMAFFVVKEGANGRARTPAAPQSPQNETPLDGD